MAKTDDGIVRTGTMGQLAEALTQTLGRTVVVHRSKQSFRKPGARFLTSVLRYSIYIEGANPEMYFGMTPNEVKARLAMLLDLAYSWVFVPIDRDGTERPVSGDRPVIALDQPETPGDPSPGPRGPIDDTY